MKIVVVGGTGLAGSRVVRYVAAEPSPGLEVVVASRATGVNSFTGDGLEPALEGADVVIDTTNSSYTDEAGATEFFEVSTLNLVAYGRAAGVRHHVVLSIVGVERLAESEGGYFRGKRLQERLVEDSGLPYTIVHATQFFEFMRSIADAATVGHRVSVADAFIQPMAVDEVASGLARVAFRPPANGIVELAGPQRGRLIDFIRFDLTATHDPRDAVADPLATYFGELPSDDLFLPGPSAELSTISIQDWIKAGRTTERS